MTAVGLPTVASVLPDDIGDEDELFIALDLDDDTPGLVRPHTRRDCASGPRPCPWASCSFHALVLRRDVRQMSADEATDLLWRLADSCVLDVADREGATLGTVADVLGVTKERVRQIEVRASAKLSMRLNLAARPGETFR